MNKQEPANCTSSELSIYLQGLEAGYSQTCYSDTCQCAQSKLNPIASKSYQHGKKTVSFHGFPSLRMCKNSMEIHGEELLTLSQEDSLAKILVAREKEKDSTENEVACGEKCGVSLAKYDHNTCSWKTHQFSLLGGLEEFSETFPKWGIMHDGELLERIIPAHLTSETESGFLLPTPTCADAMWPTPRCFMHKDALTDRGKSNLGEVVNQIEGMSITGQLNPTWVEWLMGWPLGWTDLKPLETDKFRKWRLSHGEFSPENEMHPCAKTRE